MSALVTGFATGFALILAIGAQNAFVLRQGLMRQHVLPLVLLCSLSDALLIAAGVAGFGVIVAIWPIFPVLMALGGALFLLVYGAQRMWAAIKGDYEMMLSGQGGSLRSVLLTGAALTWLNPHVYLDTLGLVGAVSTQFAGSGKLWFGVGAVAASFTFFFSLGFGARLLAPLLQSARSWRILDALIAVVMWTLAIKLLASLSS